MGIGWDILNLSTNQASKVSLFSSECATRTTRHCSASIKGKSSAGIQGK